MKLAFNKEFLKFNPIMFLIKRFTFGNFFVASPLIGFCIGLFAGLLDQVGFIEKSIITDFIQHKTYFDEILAIPFGFVFDLFWTNPNESMFSFFFAYVGFSFIWYIKLTLIIYVLAKIELIFLPIGNKHSLEVLYEKNSKSLGRSYDEKDVKDLVVAELKTIELLKRY